MANTEAEVKDIQEVLKRMKPELEKAAEATAGMIDEITRNTVSISNSVKESFASSLFKNFSFCDLYERYNLEVSKEFYQKYLFLYNIIL